MADSVSQSETCPVCLDQLLHPLELPCGHKFCFLCIKGVAFRNLKCCLCRQPIPADCILNPPPVEISSPTAPSLYKWYYEGANGWWQYDQRTSNEIESHYLNDNERFNLLIVGHMYQIDLKDMQQIRLDNPRRRRNIKRDRSSIAKKGVAGLHINKHSNPSPEDHNNDTQTTDDDTTPTSDDTRPSLSEVPSASDCPNSPPPFDENPQGATAKQSPETARLNVSPQHRRRETTSRSDDEDDTDRPVTSSSSSRHRSGGRFPLFSNLWENINRRSGLFRDSTPDSQFSTSVSSVEGLSDGFEGLSLSSTHSAGSTSNDDSSFDAVV